MALYDAKIVYSSSQMVKALERFAFVIFAMPLAQALKGTRTSALISISSLPISFNFVCNAPRTGNLNLMRAQVSLQRILFDP